MQSELEALSDQLQSCVSNIDTVQAQVDEKEEELNNKKAEYEESQKELESKKESLLACDKNISELIEQRDKQSKELTDIDIESKKLEHKILRFHKDKKDAQKFVEHLEEKHPWIQNQKQYVHDNNFIDNHRYFGKSNTEYDFKTRNPQEAQKELNRLQDEQAKLSKQINKKVMSMFEK